MSDLQVQLFFNTIAIGDAQGLQAVTDESFDFNCHNRAGKDKGCTALQSVISFYLTQDGVKGRAPLTLKMATWLIQQGPDLSAWNRAILAIAIANFGRRPEIAAISGTS